MSGARRAPPGDPALAVVVAEQPVRVLSTGSCVYHEGDPGDAAFYVHDGIAKLVTTAVNGVQTIVALRGPGGWMGEHSAVDGHPRLTSAIAIRPLTITTVPRERLVDEARRDAELAMALLQRSCEHLREAVTQLRDVASRDGTALVAKRLLELARDPMFEANRAELEATTIIDMPISQEELASWAGVSHRSATEALRRMRDEGLISTERRRVEIHSREGLEERSGPRGRTGADEER